MIQSVKIGLLFLWLILAVCSTTKAQDTICAEKFDGWLYDYIAYVSGLSGVKVVYANDKLANSRISARPHCSTLEDILDDYIDTSRIQVTMESGRALITSRSVFTRTFDGVVHDAVTGQPVEFAGVVIVSRQKGTLANKDGRFSLTIPVHQLPDTLVVSCLGYTNAIIPLGQAVDSLTVPLVPAMFEIAEVTVSTADAGAIVEKAMQNLTANYVDTLEVLNAFFRELSAKDGVYFAANEIVAKIVKRPVSSALNDNGTLLGGRRSCETHKLPYMDYTLRGGLFNHLRIDIVKHPPSFLQKEFRNFYELYFDGIITLNNRGTFIIGFRQNELVRFPGFEGAMYIDTITYAIAGADFWYSENNIRETAQMFVQKKSKGLKVTPVRAKYSVRYTLCGARWRLHTLRGEVAFSIRDRREGARVSGVFESVSEMVITSADASGGNLKHLSRLQPTDVLARQVDLFSPESLAEYPVILPERKLEEALRLMQIKRIDSQYTK